MFNTPRLFAFTALLAAPLLLTQRSPAQTPEQQQLWDAERVQMLAVEKKKNEQLQKEREQRRAEPMGWVSTLDPMAAGGWEFRAVAADGSWAAYTTTHQMQRSGKKVTVWLRHEYAETQSSGDHRYLSVVEKAQYDCAKQLERPLLVIYYAGNNLQGGNETEQADAKTAEWNPIVPGTRDETNFMWACGTAKAATRQ